MTAPPARLPSRPVETKSVGIQKGTPVLIDTHVPSIAMAYDRLQSARRSIRESIIKIRKSRSIADIAEGLNSKKTRNH